MKIHIQRKVVENLMDSLDQSFSEVSDELTNSRTVKTGYLAANLMEIDKTELNKNIDGMISILKEIKSIKEFNPKKPL